MGRSVGFSRFAVVACACACVLILCGQALAQSTNNDGYGFEPVPGVPSTAPSQPQPQQSYMQAPPVAAPVMPVQQTPMMAAQSYPQQQSYGPPQGYAPQQQSFAPPPQQAYAPPQGYAPAPGYPQSPPPQLRTALNAAPPAPYGMVALPGTQAAMPYGAPTGENIYAGYILGAGDKVHVNVFGEEDLSGDYQVDESGMVRLPLIGTVRAGGTTAPGLGAAISGALSQGYLKQPRVSVEVTAYRPFYIIGAVNRPGNYPYVGNMTALDAVALGGGFTDKAKESTVYVRHEGSTHEEELPAGQITHIYPGDVVRVKTTMFWDAMDMISPVAGPAAIAAAALQ